jgi:hypothetical protein
VDRRTARVRRLDRVAERLRPRSGWPMYLLVEDEDDLARRQAELERLHGPRPEGHPLFIITGVPRDRGDAADDLTGVACA